ncbi:phosphoribosylamine--glycine ligase [Vreelandella utahensis]|uniref:phosphoribosylamine--glycine ligase n=1 Tax=Vreelandella halophila TaxID=86177 RepID=UPI00098689BD|nr:phosphoribosylamine--glycine ligase [Halomonas utahensis]
MQVLIIGGGGREHALAWKAAQSPRVQQVYAAPGNAGTALEPGVENLALADDDIDGLTEFATKNGIDLVIVGPEAPLVAGISDRLREAGVAVFGPSEAAAQLEGSKSFAKDFLARHSIPTAEYRTFADPETALEYIREKGAPIVVKADGLAAGKGVIVAETLGEAEDAVRDMLAGNTFGDAGHRVVVEECLVGEEASFIVMVDGSNILPLASSQDHKRVGDDDTGANTGGMGAYSPAPVVTDEVHERIMREVIEPTVAGMADESHPYTGFLYAGLMITPNGSPKVIEFNCRLGDPETQPLLMRLRSDLVELCLAATQGGLGRRKCDWDERTALGVVMAAGGYPAKYRKGDTITGLDSVGGDGIKVFHAGTQDDDNGRIVTAGGRVLCVTALGDSVAEAQKNAYAGVDRIQWEDAYFRGDIGFRALNRG